MRYRSSIIALVTILGASLWPISPVYADEWTPQHFSFEFKTGFFLPQGNQFDQFFGGCCNLFYVAEFGPLINSKYEIDFGVGFFIRSAKAIGARTGRESGEDFTWIMIPLSNSFTYRYDVRENQLLVPYIGGGLDYVFVRESFQGTTTQFFKFGYHGHAGLQILLEWIDPSEENLEMEAGINDMYLVIEGKYSQIDNFGAEGINLSGITISAGVLFEF